MRAASIAIALIVLTAHLPAQPITHGPFIGHATPDSVTVWARAAKEGRLALVVWREDEADGERERTFLADARAESDLCVVWKVGGPAPGQRYRYRIARPDGEALEDDGFRFTAPRPRDEPQSLRIAFGSCAREDDGTASVWRRIGEEQPDAVVLLGDTPYIDSTHLETQRRRYREFAAFPAMRELLRSTPWYATWDDHDFGRNDTDGRLDGKESSRRAFVEYHANPSYGDGREGIYTSFRRGPVEVFLLDTRYFAATEPSPFDLGQPTLLGREQWVWLRRALGRSTAPLKVIACGMIFNGATRPNKPDHWMSYPHERERLFRFIGEAGITGVVLVTGDIHRSRVLRYKTTSIAGYDITELITSPMHGSIIEAANAPHPDLLWDGGVPYSFLLLDADTTGEVPTLTGTFMDSGGRELCRVDLEATKLRARPYARADLPPLLEFLGGARVRHPDEWPGRREELRRLLCRHLIGSFPDETPAITSAEILETSARDDGSLRVRVRLTLDTRRRASFEVHLWIPPGDGPFPLLLTQPRDYQIPWAELALARGYMVCLYPGVDSHHREPDYPGYERVWETFRDEYPEATWTEISTKAWLASRALDHVLASYPVADGQVGIIGFSRYGKQSLIAAAFDERITSVVARSPGSPGSSPYRFTSRSTFAETPEDFPGEWFLESLNAYTGREHELPVDAHGWLGLIAPRRCLIHTAHNDGSEPTFAVERAYLEARKAYSLLGKPENLRVLYRPGQHGPITDEQRRRNLEWLDLSFGRGTARQEDFPEELIHAVDWSAWRAKQRGADLTPPPRTAGIRERIHWALGTSEDDWSDDRHDQPRFLTDAESAMMTHDRWSPRGVERIPVRFGAGVRGNVYHNPTITTPAPAVIWLHPYSYHSGYNEGYGVEVTTVYHRLAEKGLVVLAYDQCGFGLRLLEGRDFYERQPRWSRLGRMIEDARAAVDFLVEGTGESKAPLPPIDRGRVFVLGYSLGGLVGLYAAALEERIAGLACFSGFTPLRTDTSDRPTGGLRRLWDWHALQPRLGLFEGRQNELPYDFDEVLALVAPRPCLVVSPRRDREASFEDVRAAVERAREAWAAHGRSEALTHLAPDEPSRFQSDQHEQLLRWLASQ